MGVPVRAVCVGRFVLNMVCGFGVVVGIAALAAFVLGGCDDDDGGGHSVSADVVCVLPPHLARPLEVNEEEVLAMRILVAEGAGLRVGESELAGLAAEIRMALGAVRLAFPEAREIRARPAARPGALVLSVSRELARSVEAVVGEASGLVLLETGFAAFDGVAAALGGRAVTLVSPELRLVVLQADRLLNVEAAAHLAVVEGVRHSAPDSFVGDGPDVLVERLEGRPGDFRVQVVDAWGDCPSGCLYEESWRFVVEAGRARRDS